MHPLLILLVGMIVVLAGIVYFRWHPFLSLIAAALAIAVLTSPPALLNNELRESATRVNAEDLDGDALTPNAIASKKLSPDSYHVLRGLASDQEIKPVGVVRIVTRDFDATDADSVPGVVGAGSIAIQPGDRLISIRDWASSNKRSQRGVGTRVAEGFGDTCRKIGILIAMAAIIGHCLLRSGGAQRIIQTACSLVGDSRASVGFVASGFVLGIPVFFDTVFYLLIPLAKALYRRTGANYLLYVMSIVVGATMAHSLVPPTPGPLLVASELKIDLGVAIKAGLTVGVICTIAGYLFAWISNRRWSVVPELDEETDVNTPSESVGDLPPLWLSLLPILLPLILLASGANWQALIDAGSGAKQANAASWTSSVLEFASDKNIALTISAAVALMLLAVSPRRDKTPLSQHVQQALADAGSIILITAAGGALGQVIRETGIAGVLVDMMPTRGAGVLVLFVAFFVTMMIRFVQGSATVAMITAVGIIAPMATSMTLPFHPVYLFLAIGCGSKPLPWMNDSGFWVIGRLSGMTPGETLKSFSATLTVMGFVGFIATLIGAMRWP